MGMKCTGFKSRIGICRGVWPIGENRPDSQQEIGFGRQQSWLADFSDTLSELQMAILGLRMHGMTAQAFDCRT